MVKKDDGIDWKSNYMKMKKEHAKARRTIIKLRRKMKKHGFRYLYLDD